jgi:type I restriction enzyme R subunit
MTEASYVELPILGWLCGEPKPGTPAGGLGWTYRDEAAMAPFDRPLEDPLVEKLLVAAILRINTEVKTEAQAKLAIGALRKTMSNPDRLAANRQTLDLLRDGAKVVLNPGEDAKTVQFIAFDTARQNLNDFTATESAARTPHCWSTASRSSSPSTRAMSLAPRTGARQCISSTDISAKRR